MFVACAHFGRFYFLAWGTSWIYRTIKQGELDIYKFTVIFIFLNLEVT